MNGSHRAFSGWNCALVILLLGSLSSPPSNAQEKKTPDPKPEEVLPVKMSGFSDSGVFHLYKDEDIVVRVTFLWKEDGHYESKSVLEIAGQKLSMDTTITPDAKGYWTKIE